MPNRFSAAFRRKSATSPEGSQDLQNLHNPQVQSTEQSSFRVLERTPPPGGRAFDGGARMARASGKLPPKHTHSGEQVEDNMFAGLNTNGYRGSGGSNTTKATSTDTSSRHSNASTAPSSADMAHTYDDARGGKRVPAHEPESQQPAKSGGSFLERAGRTFSFGMQKKNAPPPPKDDPIPDLPPLPTFQREDETGRTRAMTASTSSTATPPKVESSSALDLGGDFSSMFTGFDKRASAATLRNEPLPDSLRPGAPAPLTLDTTTPVDLSPSSWNSHDSNDNLMSSSTLSPAHDPALRHQPSFEYRSSATPGGIVEDADAKFLADSVAATKFLSGRPAEGGQADGDTRDQGYSAKIQRKPVASESESEDNMFAGTTARFSRPAYRGSARAPSPPLGGRVMTTAEFERLRKQKDREHLERTIYGGSAEDDDDDDINYDDDDDEEEKLKAQAKLRRNKQVKMMEYRQKNMKTTGNVGYESPPPSSRPSLPSSLSAPQLGVTKPRTPSPGAARRASEEDDDEEIPLAILQAHGFPSKDRAPSRLSAAGGGSTSNLRATAQAQGLRSGSAMGESSSGGARRASTLPVFARDLPQDVPYIGANVSRPAVRESLPYSGGAAARPSQLQPPPMHPGGLVGVIASEERAKAMRRGSPNTESQKLWAGQQGYDSNFGIPAHSMYERGGNQSAAGIPRMPQQPALTPADQAQLQMSQQMTQFMQMQMRFMQMMAENQAQGGQQHPMQFQMPQQMQQMQQQMSQQPYGVFAGSQSQANLSSGQSMSGQPMGPRRPLDPSMRTMSMIQPNTSSAYLNSGYGPPHGQGAGYTPSIAPSERSNVGLPGRYRPVSQASGSVVGQPMHQRPASMSGELSLSQTDDSKSRSTIKAAIRGIGKGKAKAEPEEDDDEGWQAMRAKREQKKSRWRRKKDNDNDNDNDD